MTKTTVTVIANPRKARREIAYIVYFFPCPWCVNGAIEIPDNGSVDWSGEDLSNYITKYGNIVNCNYCGKPVRI